LIESFNGKPQALPLDFAYASGSPLNENDQIQLDQHPGEPPVCDQEESNARRADTMANLSDLQA
jgi:hypothetical protein